MGSNYLIDTSAASKSLTGGLSSSAMQLMVDVLYTESLLSVITRIELLIWNPPSKALKADVQFLIDNSTILLLTEPVILQTIRLRRQYKTVKLPDAIIAATAIVNDLILLSTNNSDFEKIANLKYRSLSI